MLNIPLEERPRERLLKYGTAPLATTELLAILLGSGTQEEGVLQLAHTLYARFGSLSALLDASVRDLCQVHGIGPAKAIQLKAALALSHRLQSERQQKEVITTPEEAYLFVSEALAHEKREVFALILLNVKGEVMRLLTVSIGTLTLTVVHPREVFALAIEHRAHALILVHNHPSGDLTPSSEDLHLTRRLIEAGKLLQIPIEDHIIVSKRGFYSFKSQNNLNLF